MSTELTPGNNPTTAIPGSREILHRLGIRPSKGLGQNFLVDETVPPKILAAAAIGPDDCVIEIGPGVGVLTLRLVRSVRRLTAVELDQRLYPFLRQELAPFPGARLVEGDALDFNPVALMPEPYKLVANIPYYITSAILRHFLESEHRPTKAVLMVQKEVAQRVVAQPPDMSLLAVSVQFYGKPSTWSYVPAGAFFPPPKVDSAILAIDVFSPAERPCPDVGEKQFFEVARAGFSQKRKQLANSLTAGLPKLTKEQIQAALAEAGIAGSRRAETLTLPEWGSLTKVLNRLQNN